MFNKALIIGILLVVATFSVSANEVQKWEYRCTMTSNMPYQLMRDIFNKMGDQGWEMVGIVGLELGEYLCFKRKKS